MRQGSPPPIYRVLATSGSMLRLACLDDGSERLTPTAEGQSIMAGDFVCIEPASTRSYGAMGTVVRIAAAPNQSAFPDRGGEVERLWGRRRERLVARDQIFRKVRQFFYEEGFTEVETPLLVPSPGLEVHLDAFTCGTDYLITSPEYQMKRLLAGGMGKIFQICKCFRAGEEGDRHNPEFTMLEWYRAGATYETLMDDCDRLLAAVLPSERLMPSRRLTMAEAFSEFAKEEHRQVPTTDEAFWPIYLNEVEPKLGQGSIDIVCEWPAYLAALARRKPENDMVAERFELFAGGMELVNAFSELTNAPEQRARFKEDLATRQRLRKPAYPIDERFLAALDEGLPPSAGAALGLDRLVMLATGAHKLEEVVTFTSRER